MKHHNSKQIMSQLRLLTDEQKCIGLRGFFQWQRLPWVQQDDDKMWTCELLRMKMVVHPLNCSEEASGIAESGVFTLLDICWPSPVYETQFSRPGASTTTRGWKSGINITPVSGPSVLTELDIESQTEMRLLPDKRCDTPGCGRRAKAHMCKWCNVANYCRASCAAADKGRHRALKKGNQLSECDAMDIATQAWNQWQKFITHYAASNSLEDILHKIQNCGDDWLHTAEDAADNAAYESPAASGALPAAPHTRTTLSSKMFLEKVTPMLNKWQNICDHLAHMTAASAEVFFREWFLEVPWGKSKLSRLAASVSAAAMETKLAELRTAVAAAAERERVSITQRTEEQKQHQALQSRLAEVHFQLAEEKKQRSEEQLSVEQPLKVILEVQLLEEQPLEQPTKELLEEQFSEELTF